MELRDEGTKIKKCSNNKRRKEQHIDAPITRERINYTMTHDNNCNNTNHHDVYMTRHSARADREISGWTPLFGRKRDDTEISSGGKVASDELAARLENVSIAHIVSSPFYRCLQTVAPIAIAKDIPIKVEPGICEVLSTFPPGFWETEQLAQEFPMIDQEYQPILKRQDLSQEHGDSQAAKRSQKVATTLRKHLDGPILFCGHGASCLGIASAFGASGYVGYSSFSHFRPGTTNANKSGGTDKVQSTQWQVLAFGDVSHLSADLRQQSMDSAW